ncbi:hypothetical protein WD277_23025, partial [Pseudomonas fragi]
HLGLLALMAVYFTENRISWVYVQSLEIACKLVKQARFPFVSDSTARFFIAHYGLPASYKARLL